MARKLFGTDGIRGVAGEAPLDPQTAHAFGAALGEWAAEHESGAEVIIGMDTRESGPWLAEQVAGGLARRNVKTRFAGLITTPGVAFLTRTEHFVAGVMISASHNPFQDNGLKAFDHSGFKLPDDEEKKIEEKIFALIEGGIEANPLALAVDEGLDAAYINYLASIVNTRFDGMKLVIDCANGASAHLAQELFERLGAEVHPIGVAPNGQNINLDCGTLYVDKVKDEVLRTGADLGIAFDGDADRAMLVSKTGKIIDGDCVLLIAAVALNQQGRLNGKNGVPVVVATVMSNLGLEKALNENGIQLLRTPVGDKYVLEGMVDAGAILGGEQSGHVIFRDHATTGDGLLTALRVMEVMEQSGQNLDDLTKSFKIYPQLLVNVKVKLRKPLSELLVVQEEIRIAEQDFGNSGRVVVRFSGTEPLARVMVEGPDLARVEQFAGRIAHAIRAELGS